GLVGAGPDGSPPRVIEIPPGRLPSDRLGGGGDGDVPDLGSLVGPGPNRGFPPPGLGGGTGRGGGGGSGGGPATEGNGLVPVSPDGLPGFARPGAPGGVRGAAGGRSQRSSAPSGTLPPLPSPGMPAPGAGGTGWRASRNPTGNAPGAPE